MKTINNYAELVKAQHALNKTLAPVETDLTGASQAYAKGAKFIYNGIMNQAKTDIAQGDALVLNTNYEAAPDVETQIANEAAVRSQMGAKNILPLDLANIKSINTAGTWSDNAYTANGITYTVETNADGSVSGIKVNGTNGAVNNDLILCSGDLSSFAGKLMTGKPAGVTGTSIRAELIGSPYTNYGSDTGNGVVISNGIGANCKVFIRVDPNKTLSDEYFYPMIRLVTDADGTYQPYAKSNLELTNNVSSLNTAIANKADSSKAYQTDDTTENTLASDDVLPFYDTSATAKRKMTVQKFAEQLVSNRNLLDNPWFTVNQRGFTSGSALAYTVDRWKIIYNPSNNTISYADEIISFGNAGSTTGIAQYLEDISYLVGKICTLSLKKSDGTIYWESFTFPSSGVQTIISETDCEVYINATSKLVGITCQSNQTLAIKAVKLELGLVSTLALDTAPNYAEELLKCQRYFQRLYGVTGQRTFFAIGYCFSNAALQVPFMFKCQMRANPTISYNGQLAFYDASEPHDLPNTALINLGNSADYCVRISIVDNVNNPFTAGAFVQVGLAIGANNYIDFSADL